MIVIGLTGGIGMGKSTVAAKLARMGAKICNADALVHAMLSRGGSAVAHVGNAFPTVVKSGEVDRKALGDIVFKDKKKLKTLEQLLHPLVVAIENDFIAKQHRLGTKCVVLDIPLLFETGGEKRCDVTITVTAPHFIQRQRVMQRPGMTEEKFARILSMQMPDREKQKRADVVLHTGLGKAFTVRQLKGMMESL